MLLPRINPGIYRSWSQHPTYSGTKARNEVAIFLFLFCFVLRLWGQQVFSHFNRDCFLYSNGDEVSCSRPQQQPLGEDQTSYLEIKSDALPTELSVLREVAD